MSAARWIDVVMGGVLAVFGIWGLIPAAGGMVFGVFQAGTLMSVIALIAAAILLYGAAGSGRAHTAAATVGTVFALGGILALFSRDLFGLMPLNGWTIGLLLVSAALLYYDWLGTSEEGAAPSSSTPLR
jgi:hypothetical protein